MPLIQELDFIGIPSQDADRARDFYRDVLGMRPDEPNWKRSPKWAPSIRHWLMAVVPTPGSH